MYIYVYIYIDLVVQTLVTSKVCDRFTYFFQYNVRACNTCCIQNAIYIIGHGGNRMAGMAYW